MWQEFVKRLRFTKSEARVIVFIALVIASGYIIRNIREFGEELSKPVDYTGLDSEFINKSLGRTSEYRFSAQEDTADHDVLRSAIELDSAGRVPVTNDEQSEQMPGETVNINTAAKEELETLPGIGEAMAERIIIYREGNGSFRRKEDLMKVKGIGKKKYEKLKDLIKTD